MLEAPQALLPMEGNGAVRRLDSLQASLARDQKKPKRVTTRK